MTSISSAPSASGPDAPPRQADQLRAQLDAYRRRLERCEPGSAGFADSMTEFLGFVGTYGNREAYAACERAGWIAEAREFFAPRVLAFTAEAERAARAALLESAGGARLEGVAQTLESHRWGAQRGLAKALELVDADTCERALMVGCGPLPDSLLHLHDATAIATLVGVERDPEAWRQAADLVAQLGRDRIEIASGDGREIDYGGFDLVLLSVFAEPRRAILERVAATAAAGAAIVLRDPDHTGTLLFERLVDNLPGGLTVRHAAPGGPGGPFMLRYFLLGATGD